MPFTFPRRARPRYGVNWKERKSNNFPFINIWKVILGYVKFDLPCFCDVCCLLSPRKLYDTHSLAVSKKAFSVFSEKHRIRHKHVLSCCQSFQASQLNPLEWIPLLLTVNSFSGSQMTKSASWPGMRLPFWLSRRQSWAGSLHKSLTASENENPLLEADVQNKDRPVGKQQDEWKF